MAEAFERHAGIDLLATIAGGDGTATAWLRRRRKRGVRIAADDTWGDMFSRVLVESIEPQLGIGRATILD